MKWEQKARPGVWLGALKDPSDVHLLELQSRVLSSGEGFCRPGECPAVSSTVPQQALLQHLVGCLAQDAWSTVLRIVLCCFVLGKDVQKMDHGCF